MSLYGIRQLSDSFRTVRRNTIQIAEEIPEAGYQFRPAPASRSVAETLVHIAWLAGADYFMHEEKRLASFDGFDFGRTEKQTLAFPWRRGRIGGPPSPLPAALAPTVVAPRLT